MLSLVSWLKKTGEREREREREKKKERERVIVYVMPRNAFHTQVIFVFINLYFMCVKESVELA